MEPNTLRNGRCSFFAVRKRLVVCSTDGEPPARPAGVDKAAAMAKLDVTEVPFESLSGNTQGYATKRNVAINPVAALPHKTCS